MHEGSRDELGGVFESDALCLESAGELKPQDRGVCSCCHRRNLLGAIDRTRCIGVSLSCCLVRQRDVELLVRQVTAYDRFSDRY